MVKVPLFPISLLGFYILRSLIELWFKLPVYGAGFTDVDRVGAV
jgi:hypothetical protein